MNQANFTISFSAGLGSKGDSEISGTVNTLSLGMGIFHGWMFLIAIGARDVFPELASYDGGTSQLFLTFIITFGLAMLFIAFTNQRLLPFYVSKRALVVSTLLAVLGTILVMIATLAPGSAPALLDAAGFATGLGSALMMALWGVAFSRYEMETVVLNTALATAVGVLTYLLIMRCPITALTWALCFLTPIASVLLLWRQTPIAYYLRNEIPIFHPLKVNQLSFSARFGLPVILFGAGLGLVRFTCLGQALPKGDVSSLLLVIFGVIVGFTLVASTAVLVHKGSHWDRVFRTLMPFVALSALSFSITIPALEPLAHFALVIGYICFESLLWIYFSDLSEEFRISPLFLFGLGRSLMALATAAAVVLVFGADACAENFQVSPSSVTALLLFLMILGSSLLPRHREIRPIVTVDKSHDSVYRALEERADAEARAKGCPSGFQADQEFEAETDEPAEEAHSDEAIHSKGRFRARCEEIADQYMLSRRETEVMFLLAKGHNATYIQEKLYISKSTTKTHMNHIYRKLDIHTQQELLCMVEVADDSAAITDESPLPPSPSASAPQGPSPEGRSSYRLQADIFAPQPSGRPRCD